MKTAVLVLGGSTTGPVNNGVRYVALAAGGSAAGWFSSINNAKTPFAAPGTISDLIVNLPAALTGGQTWEFMVMLNGSPTALVVTIDSTGLVQADHVHSFAVAKGDTVSLRSTPTGTPTAQTTLQASFVFEGSTTGESVLFSTGGAGTVANFMAPGCSSGSNSAEAIRSGVMPCAGDISELYIVASSAPGGSTSRVVTLRKNGVDTGLTATITGAATTASATPTTVSFVAGDVISFGQTLPSGTPASASVQMSCNWKPTVDGQGLAFGVTSGAPSTSAVVYVNFRGASASNEATETDVLSIAPVAITIDLFRADISTACGASKHRVFKSRKTTGGVTSDAQTVDINGASATSGTDGTDVSLAAGDFIDVSTTPSGTPAAVTWARTSAIVTVDATPPGISFAPTDTDKIVWEALRTGSASIKVQGDYTGTPTDVQVRLVDGTGTQVAAWASASSQTGGHYSHTFTGITGTGPYYQRVRDNGGTATSSVAKQYVGAVAVAWGQSQCHRLGLVDLGGATPVAGVTTYVSISVDTPAGVITAKDVVTDVATIGSGIINIHNEWHNAPGGDPGPLMIVMVAHQGVSIDQYIADADPNSEGWGLWTGLVTHILDFSKRQASAVFYFQGTSNVGTESTYAAKMETLRGMFEALLGGAGTGLKFPVAPHPRSNDGNKTWALRNVQYAKAISGSPWSLLCWALDHEMDADASPHQSANAAGNDRLGTRFGRGLTKALHDASLDILGPQITSAKFTDGTRAAVEVIFDRAIHTPGGATTGLPGFCISTDDGATYTAPHVLSAAITASNKAVVTLGSPGVQSHTRLDYLRGVPYTSDAALTAEYVGAESTIEAGYLAKTITDTTAFDSSRGMPLAPVMGTGMAVDEFAATTTHFMARRSGGRPRSYQVT